MNLVEIAGHLGADAEERHTSTGKRVISLRVATKSRQGGKDETIWWRVNIWNDRFDKMLPYLKKGTGVIIVGEMSKPETWVDKEGKTQVTLTITAEIIKFSPFGKPERSEGSQGQSSNSSPYSQGLSNNDMGYAGVGAGMGSNAPSDYAGDDLPF